MSKRPTLPTVSGLSLIVMCFFGSAVLRMSDNGLALAEEIQKAVSETESPPPPDEASGLMKALKDREAQLDAEAKRQADRAQTLNVAEAKLAEQLAAFAKAQKQLEATLASADKAAEKDIDRMTAVYESMKPAEAARIIEKMDVAFASGLLSRMRPEMTAQVMSAMDPEIAYAVTLTIASRNSRVPTK